MGRSIIKVFQVEIILQSVLYASIAHTMIDVVELLKGLAFDEVKVTDVNTKSVVYYENVKALCGIAAIDLN